MDERDSAKPGLDSLMHSREHTGIASEAAPPSAPLPPPILEADLQAHIGRQLRAVYDEVVSEAVPDRFLKLLEELERKRADHT
jgi:hypothetical protein